MKFLDATADGCMSVQLVLTPSFEMNNPMICQAFGIIKFLRADFTAKLALAFFELMPFCAP